MFESLKKRIQNSIHIFTKKSRISEGDISETVKDIRKTLIQADVNYKIAKEITDEIKNEAIGTNIVKTLKPEQVFIKIVNDKLVKLMTCENQKPIFNAKTLVTLIGLQGAGKTTFAHKLAKYYKVKYKKKPLLVACDIYRPGAIEQLEILAKNNDIDFFKKDNETNINKIIKEGIELSNKNNNDVVIIDTAGRQTIDEKMMSELKSVFSNFNITESLLVLDGMIGQISIDVAKTFNETVNITGVVLTKMDADTNGGVALSISKTINKPIKFISTGEKVNDIEEFHPDRIANRILGKGDIVTLVEKIENEEKESNSKSSSVFNFETFKEYIISIENLGGAKRIFEFFPNKIKLDESEVDNNSKILKKAKYIIDSMTESERKGYSNLDISRKIRIANGSGTTLEEINKVIKIYDKISTIQSRFKNKSLPSIIDEFK